MYYLGIDPSLTATGVYFLSTDKVNEPDVCYEINTCKAEFSSSLHRVDYIASKIVEDIKKYNPVNIVMEDYFTGRQAGTVIKLAELGTMVRFRILEAGFSFFVSPPTKLKKFVSGSGSCSKDIMLKNVYKRWDVDTNSNNIADACGLAYMSQAIYNKVNKIDQKLTKYEEESIKPYSDDVKVRMYKL